MWDMKPDAPEGIRSEFAPIATAVPGIEICDQMPHIARHTDKMAIIRSFTHPSNLHEVGVYHTLTGRINNNLAVPRNTRNRNDFPNTGAVVSYFSPPQAMPASVTIPRPIGHDGVVYTGTYAGFLAPSTIRWSSSPPAKSMRHRRIAWNCSMGWMPRGCKPASDCSSCWKTTIGSCRSKGPAVRRKACSNFASRRFAC